MLQSMIGERVEIVLGPFDAVDGELMAIEDNWLKLKKKNKIHVVQIEKIRRIICASG